MNASPTPDRPPNAASSAPARDIVLEVVPENEEQVHEPEEDGRVLRMVGWTLCGLGALASLFRPKVGAPLLVVGATLVVPGERQSQRPAQHQPGTLRAREANQLDRPSTVRLEGSTTTTLSPGFRDKLAADFRRRFPQP